MADVKYINNLNLKQFAESLKGWTIWDAVMLIDGTVDLYLKKGQGNNCLYKQIRIGATGNLYDEAHFIFKEI